MNLTLFFGAFHHSHILQLLRCISSERYYCPQDGQFAKHCQTPLNHRFQLDLWRLPSERDFGALTVKLSLNPIITRKMADLQNSVTRPLTIVFIQLFSSSRQSATLELLV